MTVLEMMHRMEQSKIKLDLEEHLGGYDNHPRTTRCLSRNVRFCYCDSVVQLTGRDKEEML